MQSTHSLLNKLVALTHERDEHALELTLVQTIADLVNITDANNLKTLTLYQFADIEKTRLSARVPDQTQNNRAVTDALTQSVKQDILHCFNTGEAVTCQSNNDIYSKLYPLKNSTGQVIDVVGLLANHIDTPLDTSITLLLKIFQNFTALVQDNICDTLTGLLNRKTFDQKINKMIMQQTTAKREADKQTVCFVAIFDIDHFKRVNDTYGHLIGDEVLLMFAQLMQESFRESDSLFRFGGEEFVCLFECKNVDNIMPILERFKQRIANFKFPQVGTVTVSIGYTQIAPFDISSKLIDRADSALYYAKSHGRNRIDCCEKLIADGLLQEETNKDGDIELF